MQAAGEPLAIQELSTIVTNPARDCSTSPARDGLGSESCPPVPSGAPATCSCRGRVIPHPRRMKKDSRAAAIVDLAERVRLIGPFRAAHGR